MAAGAIALAGVALLAVWVPTVLFRNDALQAVMLSAGPVERHYRLSDGSSLTLGALSVIDIRISHAERRAELRKGKATIVVAKDRRPFRLVAGSVEKEANQGMLAASLNGSVGAVSIEMHAEEQSMARPLAVSVSADRGSGQPASSLTAPIEFAGTPLDDAVAQINEGSSSHILLLDPSLATLRITGVFRRADATGLARVLRATFDLELVDDGRGMIGLRRK